MITSALLSLALTASPTPEVRPLPQLPHQEVPKIRTPGPVTPAPAAAPKADAKADPTVTAAVERMQKFYEQTRDFTARFHQTYTYKSFGKSTQAQGRVRFLRQGGQMRWDYLDAKGGETKVFIVTGKKLYAYDKAAKQLTVAGIDTDKLSASMTFLMGKGKLEREFTVKRAARSDLGEGLTLELTPKKADPRFKQIFFVVDAVTSAVNTSLVVDPDGSENRIDFQELQSNTGVESSVFRLDPPPGTQILNMDGKKK